MFSLAFVLDVVYQVIVFRWVYPFELLAVRSIILRRSCQYLLLRGLVNRIARIWGPPQNRAAVMSAIVRCGTRDHSGLVPGVSATVVRRWRVAGFVGPQAPAVTNFF